MAVSRVMEWLDSLGPGDMESVTNCKVLEVLDLEDKTATAKLHSLVIAMSGIHPSWKDHHLNTRFTKYLGQSKSSRREVLEADPSGTWHYLVKVVRGNLHRPALLSPKLPENLSKVARLLHTALEKHGDGEQECEHCRRWGDHNLCGCLEVVYCSLRCQEMDTEHTRVCMDLEEKNPMLLHRSDLRHRQRANSMVAAVKKKDLQLRRLLDQKADQVGVNEKLSQKLDLAAEELHKARATLGLARKVSLLEQKLARVPKLSEGDSLVALSVPKQEGVARLVPLHHPFLKLWQGQLEVKPDPPALLVLPVAEPALQNEPALPAEAAFPADPALPAQPALQAGAALPVETGLPAKAAAPDEAPAAGQALGVPIPLDALAPAAQEVPEDAPGPAAGQAVRKSRTMARERGKREKAPPRFTRRDKGVFVELGISHRPFSKV